MDSGGRFLFNPPACGGNMLYLGGAAGDSFLTAGGRTMLSMSMQDSSKRQPFFRSPDDLYDGEYYDDELYPEKKRRLTNDQVQMLEKSFEEENKLEPERKSQLAKKLGLQPRQVAVWFQNRRARWKTKQLERDYDVLKASYDLLMSNYGSIVKENAELKSKMASLTEKCVAKELDGGEAPIPCVTSEPPLADIAPISAPRTGRKAEDRLSSGSDNSAVIDDSCPNLIDSGDSYFPGNEYPPCTPLPTSVLQMEYDDRNNYNNNNLFSDMFAATNQQSQEGVGPQAWWAWP